jgi:hypothetical protein
MLQELEDGSVLLRLAHLYEVILKLQVSCSSSNSPSPKSCVSMMYPVFEVIN